LLRWSRTGISIVSNMAHQYCTQCGSQISDEARFCTQCGTARAGTATGAPRATAPLAAPTAKPDLGRYAPLLVVLTVVGLVLGTIFVGLLAPKQPPQIVQRQGTGAPAAGQPGAAPLPQDHPPLTIPAQVREAILDLEKKAEENKDDLRTWSHLGEVLYRAGQIEKPYLDGADRAFRRVLELEADNLDALRGLGNIAYERNATADAIGFYQKFLAQKPDDLSVRTDLGTMFLASGDVEAAVRTYDAVLKEDPKFFQAQFNLAIAYRTAGQEDAALASLRQARDNAPDEDTRKQIDELLARVATPGAPGAAPGAESVAAPAAPPGSAFRTAVESIFRTHQILASKVQRLDWQDDTNLTAVLTGFPMAQMPPEMRTMFLTRMQDRIAAAKQANGVSATVTIELVDFESGERMDAIVQ